MRSWNKLKGFLINFCFHDLQQEPTARRMLMVLPEEPAGKADRLDLLEILEYITVCCSRDMSVSDSV